MVSKVLRHPPLADGHPSRGEIPCSLPNLRRSRTGRCDATTPLEGEMAGRPRGCWRLDARWLRRPRTFPTACPRPCFRSRPCAAAADRALSRRRGPRGGGELSGAALRPARIAGAGSRARLRLGGGEATRCGCRSACSPSCILAVLVAAGFLGSRDPLSNPLPLTVWTLLWVGLTLVQGLFGNLWAWINPWYGPWRIVSALFGRSPSDQPLLRLPLWLGMWPAVAAVPRLRLVRAGLSGAGRSRPACLGGRPLLAFQLRHDARLRLSKTGAGAANSCRCSSAWCRVSASSSEADRRRARHISLCLPGAKLVGHAGAAVERHGFLLLALARFPSTVCRRPSSGSG